MQEHIAHMVLVEHIIQANTNQIAVMLILKRWKTKLKLSQADIWFSKCIRKSANWTCTRCKKQYEEGSQGLHCSHTFGRRHKTIRWCKDNADAMCFSCHKWYGENPADSGKWIEEIKGSGMIQILREKRDSMVKVSKLEEKDIAKHYKSEYERIEPGEDFESWQ